MDAFEELAGGFHVRVGGAPIFRQLPLDCFLQDGMLELGEEGLLVGDFVSGDVELGASLMDSFDEFVLLFERREIDLIVEEEGFIDALAVGVATAGLDASLQEDR